MLIDFHTHIFSPDLCASREKYLKDKNFKHLYSSKKASTIDHNSLLNSMVKNDIDKSVAMGFPWLNKFLCKKQNDYLISVKEKSQGQILPFGSIPLYTKNIYKWAKKLSRTNSNTITGKTRSNTPVNSVLLRGSLLIEKPRQIKVRWLRFLQNGTGESHRYQAHRDALP